MHGISIQKSPPKRVPLILVVILVAMTSGIVVINLSVYRYHGSITRDDTARLLGEKDGNYLVRKGLSQSGTYSLSFV